MQLQNSYQKLVEKWPRLEESLDGPEDPEVQLLWAKRLPSQATLQDCSSESLANAREAPGVGNSLATSNRW